MHEMALAEGILGVALGVSDGDAVRAIRVRVGALQMVVPDSLEFCFQLAAEDTPAAGARLEQRPVPTRLHCNSCTFEGLAGPAPFHCERCGGFDVAIAGGDELLVDAVLLDSGWIYRPGAESDAPVAVTVPASHLEEHARAEAARRHGHSAGGNV